MEAPRWGSMPSPASQAASKEGAIAIRPMRLSDLAPVVLIDQLSFSLPWPESAFRYELVDNPRSFILVAELARQEAAPQVVGVIVIWEILDEAHIATLAVHPDQRRLGIASKLLLSALKIALTRGARTATLEVRSRNPAAQALYQKFRFEVVGRRPRYYRDDNDDALIMTVDVRQVDDQGRRYLDTIPD
ncbi:MAG TPA: ribosomal protein S18-alanine N-acetyltransferase [Anaerolineales bacterium]|nr:ribosomal protein S18-alanine N-acetyltransferase [Anaerolineales bacterium]